MSEPIMRKDIIVIGASAGGVAALRELVSGLPLDLNAAVFIVLHLGTSDRSHLAQVLQTQTTLPVAQAADGEAVIAGQIRVARPDYHLMLERDVVLLTRGPRENRVRPSVDALFRSAAYVYGPRAIGVVLTGALDDGSAGSWWIKERGGTVVVQDPDDAQFPSMPSNALLQAEADHILPLAEIAPLLGQLARQPARPMTDAVSWQLEVETQIAKEGRGLQAGVMDLGSLTPYTCPECHGVLVQLKEGSSPYFRCHTGHAYSINALLADVTEYVEASLWNSIRAIEESALLLNHLGRHARESMSDESSALLFDEKAADTLKRADVVRKAANEHQTLSRDNIAEVEHGSR